MLAGRRADPGHVVFIDSNPGVSRQRPQVSVVSVPGLIVRVIPAGTITSPVRSMVPDQVSLAGSVPDVVADKAEEG